MSFKSNLDKFEKDLQHKAEAVSGNVTFNELFNLEFMRKYTNSDTIDNFVSAYDNSITEETFQESLTPEFDAYIANNSKFSTWDEMQTKAGEEYLVKHLKF